jgi:hypothetical protein
MPVASAPLTRAVAGDTWTWLWSSADYPASAGWAVSWRLVGPGVALVITTTASGDAHLATASAASTGALTVDVAGVPCTLVGWASRAGERFEIYRAACAVLPNPATITGDLRGHAARTLAAINALLEGRATKDQQSYKIGERELSRIPVNELLALRDYYRAEAQREDEAAALASGRPRSRMVVTRMARA